MPVHGGQPFPKMPSMPDVPRPVRVTEPNPQLQPLKGPSIKIPGDQEEERANRWRIWQARPDSNGSGSILEFICWEYLVNLKKQIPGVDFLYQDPMFGGRTQYGGFVSDFYFPLKSMVWNPAGQEFHFTKTLNRANDMVAKALLESRGIKTIFLWEEDLIDREIYTLDHAWNGEQIGWRQL